MWVRPSADGGVDVLLGDAGGFPHDPPSHGENLDQALIAAEGEASRWLEQTRQLQQELLSEESPELRHKEFIRVAGWPPARNPHYRR
jgi:hypothetical protein